jgi:hypothetical protein
VFLAHQRQQGYKQQNEDSDGESTTRQAHAEIPHRTRGEVWTEMQVEEIDWSSFETAFKCMGWSHQVCHKMMWHTGVKHTLYYNEPHPCCICGDDTEDWMHIIIYAHWNKHRYTEQVHGKK